MLADLGHSHARKTRLPPTFASYEAACRQIPGPLAAKQYKQEETPHGRTISLAFWTDRGGQYVPDGDASGQASLDQEQQDQ
jgi:hypothetical protein